VLDAMSSEHRAAVLGLLERVAPVLYAEWVNDLLVGASEPELRAEFGLSDPDPLTGHYPKAEVLAWLEAQPLVRRLRKLRCHDCGWTPRLLDLLGQSESCREDSGEVTPLARLRPAPPPPRPRPSRGRLVGVADPDPSTPDPMNIGAAGGADRDPARVVDEIASSDGFRASLERLGAEQHRSLTDVEREARAALA